MINIHPMNKIFDNDSYNAVNNRFGEGDRYQLIYPYESDKIHIEPNANAGVHSCYNELRRSNIKNSLFMVHNIDSGTIYHLEIPKFKHFKEEKSSHKKNIEVPNNNECLHIQHPQQLNNPAIIPNQTLDINKLNSQPLINDRLDNISRSRISDIVTRLNNVEYQVEELRKKLKRLPKKEEDSCIIC